MAFGHWDLNLATNELTTSAHCRRNFGRSEDTAFSYDDLIASIHPDDREKQQEAVRVAVEAKAGFALEYRLIDPRGELRWVRIQGRYEAGDPARLIGVSQDISRRKRAEAALRESEARYRVLFQSIDEGFAVVEFLPDGEGLLHDFRFVEVNAACERQTGNRDVAGKLGSEVNPGRDAVWIETFGEVARTGEAKRLEIYHGETGRWYNVYATRVGGAESRQVCVVFADITQRREREEHQASDLSGTQLLQRLSTQLISEQSPEELHEQILEAALELMQADAVSIQLLEDGDDRLRRLATRNLHPESTEFWTWVDASHASTCGQALRTNSRVVVEDVEASAELVGTGDLEAFRASGTRAVQSTPLVSRSGRPIGMISTHWHAPRRLWDEAKRHGRLDVEYRVRRAVDGGWIWHHTRSVPVRDGEGRIVEWLGTSTDIHELREMQERQAILVAELQHRTRNLMGVVRSMADKTARASGDLPDFRGRFRDRLDALARVQGLLSRMNDHDRVTFDELVDVELAAMDGSADRVTVDGPSGVRLRSSTVQTLAMALHELATNAMKYGALGQASGRLAITWRLERSGIDDAPWLHIDWRESGVNMPPAVAAPRGTGQGRELIERALPYQLHAKTSYMLGRDGVRCTISIPVSATTAGAQEHV